MPKSKHATMKWAKAPEALVAVFRQLLHDIPDAEMRKLFGYPAAFVSGQMFSGLFRSSMMLRLSEADRAVFVKRYKAKLFEPMPGRVMREYVVVPHTLLKAPNELKPWVERGRSYAASLLPRTDRRVKRPPARKAVRAV